MLAVLGGRALSTLGTGARWARGAGLGRLMQAGRDGADAVFLRLGRPPLRVDVGGLTVRGYLRHRSFLAHLSSGTYEPEYRRLFERELRPGATVVDAGAHIGTYTLLACRAVGPAGRVVAIEPDPYNVRALEANVRRESCANVRIVRKALADAPGTARFQQSLGTISSSFEAREGRGPFRELELDVTSVDAELDGTDIDALVVKLDVEGAEPRALAGMTETVARAASVALFLEVNPSALAVSGSDEASLLAQVDALGLEATPIGDERVGSGPTNLLCVRR
jgi:FkbM family methyltransferase